MADYPVSFNVTRPEKFERPQVFLRILVIILLSMVAVNIGILGFLYLAIPVLAAIFISQSGGGRYIAEDGSRMITVLRWVMAVYAYVAALADRFPTERPEQVISFNVSPSGSPTVGSALLRLIYSIPSAFVLAILGVVAVIIWVIALIWILVQETYPEGLYNFQLGVIRWQARLLGYHASLIERYPPFALDTGQETAGPAVSEPPSA